MSKYSVSVVVVSDRVAAKKRKDECFPEVEAALAGSPFEIGDSIVVSDEPVEIKDALRQLTNKKVNLILTCGGTGCGARDNTPDVTKTLLDKPTPGVDEAIRHFSMQKTEYAMFSRAVSGVAGESFVLNLPGSPRAVAEILSFVLPVLKHPLELIAGKVADCVASSSNDD